MSTYSYLLLVLTVACAPLTAAGAELQGDAQRGAEVYRRCAACHSLERNRTGPKHCGLLGRRAGTVAGYDYSPAMREAGFIWDEAALDRFLSDPMRTVPGTKMGYAGVRDAQQRADLIAFLAVATEGSVGCR